MIGENRYCYKNVDPGLFKIVEIYDRSFQMDETQGQSCSMMIVCQYDWQLLEILGHLQSGWTETYTKYRVHNTSHGGVFVYVPVRMVSMLCISNERSWRNCNPDSYMDCHQFFDRGTFLPQENDAIIICIFQLWIYYYDKCFATFHIYFVSR